MKKTLILFALLTGCSLSHEPAPCYTDACVGAPWAYEDAGAAFPAGDAGIEWVPAERYCERLDARGCTGECPDTLCDRARADACLEAVERSDESCPDVLTQPICMGMCR